MFLPLLTITAPILRKYVLDVFHTMRNKFKLNLFYHTFSQVSMSIWDMPCTLYIDVCPGLINFNDPATGFIGYAHGDLDVILNVAFAHYSFYSNKHPKTFQWKLIFTDTWDEKSLSTINSPSYLDLKRDLFIIVLVSKNGYQILPYFSGKSMKP